MHTQISAYPGEGLDMMSGGNPDGNLAGAGKGSMAAARPDILDGYVKLNGGELQRGGKG